MSQFPYNGFLADMIDVRRTCIHVPHMLPIVMRGQIIAQNIRSVQAPAENMSVEDYVLGLFALCLLDTPPIALCDGWVATRQNFDGIPSRWAERANDLFQAFGHKRTREVADYLRRTGIGVDLANTEDHEEVRRFASPRQAIIGCALILAMRDRKPDRAEMLERARFAEPQATDAEIEAAAHITTDILAALSVENGSARRSETAR